MEDRMINPEENLKYLIESYIEQGRDDDLRDLLEEVHPADIAEVLDQLPQGSIPLVFKALSDQVASEVLDESGSFVRQELVENVDDERLADLLDELPMDDAAEFIDQLPNDTAIRLLKLMEPEEAEDVRELLSYGEGSAGRLMTRDVAKLRRLWTAAEAIDYLRSLESAEATETVHYLYVVNQEEQLIGVLPIRALLMAQAEVTISSIMVTDIITASVEADQEELAELVSKYDFVAIPVVDDQNHLLGVVTVDDILDVLEEEATEDFQRLGGSEPLTQPYFSASILQVIGKRLVWLLPLFAASIVTDAVVGNNSHLTLAFVSLTIFIPVVTGTGGNAGSQTVATIIRAIAVGEVKLHDLGRALSRELIVGLFLGLTIGIAGYVRAQVFDADPGVGIVLALTLPLVIVWANTVATLVPLIAERLKIDPAVVSAPMITTILDATGLLIYFGIASAILT